MHFATAALLTLAACLVAAKPIAAPYGGVGTLEARQGECPCAPGLCCSQFSFCGLGPDFCTSPYPSPFLTPPRRKTRRSKKEKTNISPI